MDFIICLAHFCETHGPTSVLCTQIAPVLCPTCNCCSTPPHSDDMRRSSISASTRTRTRTPTGHSTTVTSPFGSPPASPCTVATDVESYFPETSGAGAGAGMTATVENDSHAFRRLAVPDAVDDEYCQNCSFLVPKEVSSRIPRGAPGSPRKDGKGRNGSPVLRTSQSITAYGSSMHHSSAASSASRIGNRFSSKADTASFSSSSSSSTSENNSLAHSSPSSSLSMSSPTHTHRLTYISTRYPTSPAAYSNLRRSCIRTLSTENLPRGSGSGSLFFGDPIAGYSVTHVFRLPDPLARGRLRTYALIALGSRDNWKVSQVILEITRTFERLASRIVAMANRVLDNEAAAVAAVATAAVNGVGRTMASTSAPTRPTVQGDSGKAMAGIGAGKFSAPTTPIVSAASTLTSREKGGDGGVVEKTDTSVAKGNKDSDGRGVALADPADKESSTTDATTSSLASTIIALEGPQAPTSSTSTTIDTAATSTPTPTLTCSTPTPTSKLQEQEGKQQQQLKGERDTASADKTQPAQPQQEDQRQSDPSRLQAQPQHQTRAKAPPPPLRSMTPLSSFLAAKKVDPDGYPRDSHSATSMLEEAKKRGLAEIVGQEDFFVELHASFVVILAKLVSEFGVR